MERLPPATVEQKSSIFPGILKCPQVWRMNVLFVLHGYSDGDVMTLKHPGSDKIDGEFTYDDTDYTDWAIQILGELKALKLDIDYDIQYPGPQDIFYGRTPKIVERIRRKDHRGNLYGIPKTAIDAWPENSIDWNNIPKSITNHPLFEVLPFRLSKEHYQEEWDTFTRKCNEIHAASPNLVEQFGLSVLYKRRKKFWDLFNYLS